MPLDITTLDTFTLTGDRDLRRATQQQAALETAGKTANAGKIKEAAQEFEAVFISQMLEHMFGGVKTNELFGGGQSEDIYRSMMIDEYGKLIAKSGGVGIADQVTRQLLQEQDVKAPASVPSRIPAGYKQMHIQGESGYGS
jgi:peptidoglycan hydrolase FlgJ